MGDPELEPRSLDSWHRILDNLLYMDISALLKLCREMKKPDTPSALGVNESHNQSQVRRLLLSVGVSTAKKFSQLEFLALQLF